MDENDQSLLLVVGGRSIADNLEQAVAAGHISRREDGKYKLVARHGDETTVLRSYVSTGTGSFSLPCDFLMDFLFKQAYGQSTVPFGCRDCYKVKVSAASLRQLMAIKEIADSLPYRSKCGMEPTAPYYAAFFYNLGLDKAREAYRTLRQRLDQAPVLGQEVRMLIKRGCTEYERRCGPSDRYSFDPALEQIEAHLLKQFVTTPKSSVPRPVVEKMELLRWISRAYHMGDVTYKDFTDGKSLYPPIVTYPPET